ncbi:MAG: NTP transferase domain-containing protein [Actinobacteria bacterium]|nr:NTP transferase domain-containing protein [Actinomycetota bacterium]
MRDVVTAILGGGRGTRLWPLTRDRAKPAVPVAGKYRLIDIPISNSLDAGIDSIFVLTQFNSASLHRHIARTYRFDSFSSGFVNILAAEQNMRSTDWYQGTADAVRQNIDRLTENDPSEVIILSGDQLYLMDLEDFVRRHREAGADVTIAVSPVSPEEARALGIMRLDREGRLVEFVEKPDDPAEIERLTLDAATVEATGVDAAPGSLLASMGIYVFRSGALVDLLASEGDDFGKNLIPQAVAEQDAYGYVHSGYWRDIGTIGAFHLASLELTHQLPSLNLYDTKRPVYTRPRFLPPVKVTDCRIYESLLADGAILSGSEIIRSVIGIRSLVRSGSVLDRVVVMGNRSYGDTGEDAPPALGIGHDCEIRDAILDSDVSIGDGCRLVNRDGVTEADGDGWYIRDGVIVVPRLQAIPPGTVI